MQALIGARPPSIWNCDDRAPALVLAEANVRSGPPRAETDGLLKSASGAKGEPQRTIFVL